MNRRGTSELLCRIFSGQVPVSGFEPNGELEDGRVVIGTMKNPIGQAILALVDKKIDEANNGHKELVELLRRNMSGAPGFGQGITMCQFSQDQMMLAIDLEEVSQGAGKVKSVVETDPKAKQLYEAVIHARSQASLWRALFWEAVHSEFPITACQEAIPQITNGWCVAVARKMDYEPIPKSEYVGDLFARLTEIFSDSSDLIVAKAHGFNLPPVGDEETVLCEVDDPIIPRLCLLLERIGEYASGIVPDNINNKLAFDVWMGKQTVDRARFLDDQFARVNEMINLVNGLNEIAMRDAVGANCPRVIGLRQGWQVVTIKKFAH